MYSLSQLPLFQELESSENILIAGCGGGFDIYSGIPLMLALLEKGKNITLTNFSFTWLDDTTAKMVMPYCYKINAKDKDQSGRNYFPEKHLCTWLKRQGMDIDVYAFERNSVIPLREAYNYLIDEHSIDTIVVVDGGTDCLMFGDEELLGTPQEDISSLAAVYQSKVANKYLVSVGFGIDHFHGVSHFRFFENIATLSKDGAYLGVFQLTDTMKEAALYADLVAFSNEQMPDKKSIVSNSIISALQNHYGNYHATNRTEGSELWINPLMTIHWCFKLDGVVERLAYYDYIKDAYSIGDFNQGLSAYRDSLKAIRQNKNIPL